MAYVPPHLRRNANRREGARGFIARLSSVPDVSSDANFPPLCDLHELSASWDVKLMLRSEDKGRQADWWGAKKGYVYMARGRPPYYKARRNRNTSRIQPTKLVSSKLIDVLEAHTDEFYSKFPSEEIYDPDPDYVEETSDDEVMSSEDEDDWRMFDL